MNRFALVAAFACFATPALAQDAQCFQNDKFLVIGQAYTDEVGSRFLVRAPEYGKIICDFRERQGDMLIGSPGDPLHYAGLAGRYLVLTRSTGPDGNVVIYDLENLDPMTPYIDIAADDQLTVDDRRVVYWARQEQGTAENCPQFAEAQSVGMDTVIANEVVLDTQTGDVAATGMSRCSMTQ